MTFNFHLESYYYEVYELKLYSLFPLKSSLLVPKIGRLIVTIGKSKTTSWPKADVTHYLKELRTCPLYIVRLLKYWQPS